MDNSQLNQQQGGGLHPLASFFLASGGAVVGNDYAKWLEVDPVVGALIGGVISLTILQISYKIHRDSEGKIKKGFSEFGLVVGGFMGAVVAAENSTDDLAWLVGGGIGAVLGFWAGQVVAAIISLAGFAVLLLSQGPIGLAVRTWIMSLN